MYCVGLQMVQPIRRFFAVNTLQFQGRRGRPQSNLFSLILQDLSVRKLSLNNLCDLNYLTLIAQNRVKWRSMQIA